MSKLISFLKRKWFSSQAEPIPVVDLERKPSSHDVHAYCMELVLYYRGMAPYELHLFTHRSLPFLCKNFAEFLSLLSTLIKTGRRKEALTYPPLLVNDTVPAEYFIDSDERYLVPAAMLEKFAQAVEEFLSLALTEDEEGMYYSTYRLYTAPLTFKLVSLIKELIAVEQSEG